MSTTFCHRSFCRCPDNQQQWQCMSSEDMPAELFQDLSSVSLFVSYMCVRRGFQNSESAGKRLLEFCSLSGRVFSPVGNLTAYFPPSQAVKPRVGTRFKNGFNKKVIMFPDVVNDIHFLQEKQTLRLASYGLHLYVSYKTICSSSAICQFDFPSLVAQKLWKQIPTF